MVIVMSVYAHFWSGNNRNFVYRHMECGFVTINILYVFVRDIYSVLKVANMSTARSSIACLYIWAVIFFFFRKEYTLLNLITPQ